MSAVSISCDFLDSMMKLPGPIQRKVRQFVTKFMSDPKSTGINYERIQQAQDRNLRSVRIDQAYRAIIFKSPKEDVHLLLWVDHHDDAYTWACRRRMEINPRTGALQVILPTETQTEIEPSEVGPSEHKEQKRLLEGLSKDDLLDCGVPESALAALALVRDESDLEHLRGLLPQESYEALSYLASGIPIDEVKAAFEARKPDFPQQVDVDNYEAALEHPDTWRRFARVSSQKELEEILDAPLEKWRVFLHPSQQRLVDKDYRGPVKVLGGPGTGKTVVAIHRAKHLAETGGDASRVLLTTFTSNLAENLEAIMKGFVDSEGRQRLDVLHLHSWLTRFLRSLQVPIAPAEGQEVDEFWRQAMASTGVTDWSQSFLQREFNDVVLPNDVVSRDQYLTVSRRGAKGALRRSDRARLWPVLEEYRRILDLNGKQEWLMLVQEARKYLEAHPEAQPYSHVVIDEAQDFHPEEWRLIRALVPAGPNDLFLVGDAHQRIYGRRVVLSHYGIDTRGRSSTLKLNYRTTHQIRSWATAMFNGRSVDDLEEGSENLKGYISLLAGHAPEVQRFDSEEQEAHYLASFLKSAYEEQALDRVCIVGRTHSFLKSRVLPLLARERVPYSLLQRGTEVTPGTIAVATMHRVKGLEFPTMLLMGVEEGLMPLKLRDLTPEDESEHESQERALLFVAATRAR